jgi:antitoxin VapB
MRRSTHRDDERLVIEPVRRRDLVVLPESMKPLNQPFPEVDDPAPPPERPL